MRIVSTTGDPDIAVVYVAETENGELIEFVESIQPPKPRSEKWVLMVSTLYGCPVKCKICDAGGFYHGRVSADEILEQIDYMVDLRHSDRKVNTSQFKIQFARMGEPAFNPAVLDVLSQLPSRYDAPGLIPSISTIAPESTDAFFEELLNIKNDLYSDGKFQFQFSVHSTDEATRNELMPVKKWAFEKMAAYAERFYQPGDRKITLNFALAQDSELDPDVMKRYFNPDLFLIKITPLNPTYSAETHKLASFVQSDMTRSDTLKTALTSLGYDVIISIGEWEENKIGSNCGQYILKHINAEEKLRSGYSYPVHDQ